MSNTIRIKRRAAGGAPGSPTSLENAELAYNEQDDILYYGKGTGGAGGTATQIIAIAGFGAYLTLLGNQTVSGNKTFTGTTIVPTPENNNEAANKGYVDSVAAAGTIPDGNKGDITISGSGANWAVNNGAITNVKMAPMPAFTIKGNNTGASATSADLSAADVKTMLSLVKADVGLGNVDNTSDASKPVSTATQSALDLKADLDSPGLTGTPTAPTAAPGNNTTQLANTAFVISEIAARLAAADAMTYRGAIDASTNPNYPAADAGDTYRINVAGKIGGASGINVKVGDLIICHDDASAAGDHATVGINWDIIQINIDGLLSTDDIGSIVQAYSNKLTAIADLTFAANQGLYATGADTFSTYSLTAGGRALGGVAGTADTFPYFSAANVVSLASVTAYGRSIMAATDAAAARTELGLGTMATQNANNVNITGGSIDNIVLDCGEF